MIGQTISQYTILEKLGEGGMGIVYKAQDTKLDRLVALKFLPHNLTANADDKARFLQEAKAAAALNHPNICTIHGIDDREDRPYIVMEFVDGESLKAQVKQKRLSVSEVIEIGQRIAEGLNAAHERGVVHRDIKSDNIMVTREGIVKIMDFGLAKLRGSAGLTRQGSTIGTMGYMAPEQIQGIEVTQQADLWSFGVVLYELLTGELPFNGEHEAAMMYEVLNVDPPGVQKLRPDAPEALQILISQMLQKERSKRVARAKEVSERLRRVTTDAPVVPGDTSIAVLYFENMSSEKESDYFCAGITEDIITDLSKLKKLKVVSRTDVLPFRNKEVNTRQVGQALGVSHVLEGSVRKAGNKIRITAQLIDVRSGFHVWADRFDRLVEDIFDLQNEVSQKIAEALKVSLSDSEMQLLSPKPTEDLRAYDFYLRGRELMYVRGKKSNEKAIQMFEHAISFDANYALAYAALAEAYSNMYLMYDGDPVWLGKTIQMNQKALSLSPDSIEAQFGIAMVYLYQRRLTEAKKTLESVIQQKPDSYDAIRWLGIFSDMIGDYPKAIQYYKRAAEIKPYSEEPWMHLDMTYRRSGDAAAAEEAGRKIVEIGERKYEVNPEDVLTLSRLAISYGTFGEKEKAYSAIKRVMELAPGDGLALYNCAGVYNSMGETQNALTYLRRALQMGGNFVREWVKTDPYFDSMRGDSAFETLLAEFG